MIDDDLSKYVRFDHAAANLPITPSAATPSGAAAKCAGEIASCLGEMLLVPTGETPEFWVPTIEQIVSRHFPPTEVTQTWCDHCSADLNDIRHILCERCYRDFDKSINTRESLRASILDWLAHRCDRAPVCGNCTYCRIASFVRSVEVTEVTQPAVEGE